MVQRKRRKKENTMIAVIIVIIVVILIVVVGGIGINLGKDSSNSNKNQSQVQNDSQVIQQNSQQGSTLEQQVQQEEGFSVETAYEALSFPEKWKDKIHIEKISGDVSKVMFYGVLEGKDELHLFDIAFGGDEGFVIGHLTTSVGKMDVRVISYDIEQTSDMSSEEFDEYCAMQEDVNYIIQKLKENTNFKEIN